MKTHAEILALAASLAPSIAIETIWEHDDDASFTEHGMTEPGGCFHGEEPDDWQAWQSEVKVTAIVGGKLITGSDYLGGTWHKYGEDPQAVNPDISGYFPQMLSEALLELTREIQHGPCPFPLTETLLMQIESLQLAIK